MNGNFDIAIELLGVGMITVFLILFLVVFIGYVIIKLVNRYLPQVQPLPVVSKIITSAIHPDKMAAIVSAVQTVTNGKGKVVKVEKL